MTEEHKNLIGNTKNNKRFLSFIFYFLSSRGAGFTLVEVVISLGLFAVLVIATVGIVISISRAQAKASQVQAVQDNIRFSLELITREMRTGGNYKLTTNCTAFGLGTEVEFTNFNPNPAEYRRYYIADSDSNGTPDMLMRLTAPDANFDGIPDTVLNCTNALPFTSEEVIIDRFVVALRGQALGANDGQPMATILLRVRSRSPRIELA